MSGLQSCERINFLPCQMPSGWSLVTAAQGEHVGHLVTGESRLPVVPWTPGSAIALELVFAS